MQGRIEVISLLPAKLKQLARVDRRCVRGRKPQVQGFALQARQFKAEARGDFGARVPANRRLNAVHQVIIDAILERPRRRLPIQPGNIALVFAEQPLEPVLPPGAETAIGQFMMEGQHLLAVQPQLRLGRVNGPAPVIARPQLGQHVQLRRLIRTVMHGDPHENIVGMVLGVFDADVAIAVVFKHAGVEDFVLGIFKPAAGVLGDQVRIRKRGMRVFVEHAHIGMARYAIDEKVQFLDVFTVVALGVIQTEQALLDDRVAPVPKRQAQAPALSLVAEPGQPVLTPTVGAAAGMFMGEVGPGIAIGAVVFAHRAPLAFTQVRAPVAPTFGRFGCQALAFNRCEDVGCRRGRHRVLHH